MNNWQKSAWKHIEGPTRPTADLSGAPRTMRRVVRHSTTCYVVMDPDWSIAAYGQSWRDSAGVLRHYPKE